MVIGYRSLFGFHRPQKNLAILYRGSCRDFSNTRSSWFASNRSDGRTHYDVLEASPSASGLELKRSFYELSKTHHPDRNPSDPSATSRFVEISEAYSVLSNIKKRAEYDRSINLHRQLSKPARTGQAGGRPASGLSRRPTVPQGSPPSYYRDQSAYWRTRTNSHDAPGYHARERGYGRPSEFNWDSKYRQHYDYEQRKRGGESGHEYYYDDSGFWMQAFGVGGCVLLVGALGGVIAARKDSQNRNPD